MKLRKNGPAKLFALVATFFTLVGTFVLVHGNPPASDAATQPTASVTDSSQAASGNATASQPATSDEPTQQSNSTVQQPAPVTTTHTRTHAS